MKKVAFGFMIFLAVFLVSCGAVTDEAGPKNTVRITMPSARSASAGGAEDVDYYNIQIARQSFSNVRAGDTVESAPIAVGTRVSISVEAIGKIKDNGQDVGSGRRVAYYQTTQTLPASGLTLNVNMANYKTEYYKVTLEPNGFNGQQTSVEVYVAGGSSYALPNYGTYTPPQGSAQMHISWRYTADPTNPDNVTIYKPGETVAITRDMEFELDYEELATITFDAYTLGADDLSGSISGWTGTAYVRKNTRYTPPTYASFTYNGLPYTPLGWEYGNVDVNFGESVEITTDASFYLKTKGLLRLDVTGATIDLNDSIIERDGQYYIWTQEPFILPTGRKDDGSDVTEWSAGGNAWLIAPGASLTYGNNGNGAGWSSEASGGFFDIRPNR